MNLQAGVLKNSGMFPFLADFCPIRAILRSPYLFVLSSLRIAQLNQKSPKCFLSLDKTLKIKNTPSVEAMGIHKMQKRNWKAYNNQLIQRGSLTFLLDPKVFKTKKIKTFGRPQSFSDSLIIMLMMTKIHYHLSYRALQGFANSFISLVKQNTCVPTYSLICKRAAKLKLPKLSSKRPAVVAIDASGVKVYGEGEWKIKIHGKSKRRKWLKIHLAVDPKSKEIIAQTTTISRVHDGQALKPLLNQVPRSLKKVLADGAYDGKSFRKLISQREAQPLIPPPKNARLHNRDLNRDAAIQIIRALGGDKRARSLWGKLTG